MGNTTVNTFPLTTAQAGIWYAQQRDPESTVFNIGEYVGIQGALQVEPFCLAVEQTINECEPLHLRFIETTDGPRQYVAKEKRWELQRLDFSDAEAPLTAALQWMRSALHKPVDLSQGPLFVPAVIRLAHDHYLWFQGMHHIATDAYGLSLLAQRVAEVYRALTEHKPVPASKFGGLQTILAAEDAYIQSPQQQQDAGYWQREIADSADIVNMAGRFASAADDCLRQHTTLPASVMRALQAKSQAFNCNWPELILATAGSYLQRIIGADTITLGIPLMGRLGSPLIRTPAMLVNILPMQLAFDISTTLHDITSQVKQKNQGLRQHHQYRYENLQREFNRRSDSKPLFGSQVNIMPFDYRLNLGDCTTRIHNLASGPVDDISIYVYARSADKTLELHLEANPKLYNQAELDAHLTRFCHWLQRWLSAENNTPLHQLPLLTADEQQAFEQQWQATEQNVPATTLPALFVQQAEKTPQATALVFNGESLSYHALNLRANQLAQMLRQHGMGKGSVVALALPRSFDLLIAMYATHKAGAAYLPLDPSYPQDRLTYMLENTAPGLLLTHHELLPQLPQITTDIWLLDDKRLQQRLAQQGDVVEQLPLAALSADDPAYIIYTSGSTGKPKGVVVGHQAIVNRLLWMQHQYPLDESDAVLQKTPSGFDVSVWEFFWPLQTGARLVIAKPEGHKDPAYLAELIQQQAVTTLHFVPSMLQVFLQEKNINQCQSLRRVFCSGEALPAELEQRFFHKLTAELHNLYGPTEAAVDVSYWPCNAESNGKTVPIGYPIWNTRLYVLDNNLNLLPPGCAGELYIAGMNLAHGYLNRPDLTAERFVADPFGPPGTRMYRTGDLARWDAHGSLEYLGRTDNQVKLRGLRIELGEIEACLEAHEQVQLAVVMLREDRPGDQRLVAYLLSDADADIDNQQLNQYLLQSLPDFMLPSAYVLLQSLPLSQNGKLDHKALPAPVYQEFGLIQLPHNPQEELLCHLFAEVLGLEQIGRNDNFFDLGGHSLLAVKLVHAISESTGNELHIANLFAHPSVASLAEFIQQNQGNTSSQALAVLFPLRAGENEAPLFCIHPAGGISWCYAPLLQSLDSSIPVYGLQCRGLDGESTPAADMQAMAEDYIAQMRSIQPHGPYRLLGWSIGGMVAQVAASLLQQQGETVSLLALLDAFPSDQWRHLPAPTEQDVYIALLRMAGFDENHLPSPLEKDAVFTLLRESGSALAFFAEAELVAFSRVVKNNARLFANTAHQPYHGDALFFHAANPRKEDWLSISGWQPYITGHIEQIDLNCVHQEIIKPEVLATIGKTLTQKLKTVEEIT